MIFANCCAFVLLRAMLNPKIKKIALLPSANEAQFSSVCFENLKVIEKNSKRFLLYLNFACVTFVTFDNLMPEDGK